MNRIGLLIFNYFFVNNSGLMTYNKYNLDINFKVLIQRDNLYCTMGY